MSIYNLEWRFKTKMKNKFGMPCRIVCNTSTMNSCCVEFEDGTRMITSKNSVKNINFKIKNIQDNQIQLDL